MLKIFAVLLTILVLHCSVDAADKIRIAIPNLAVQFITMPLAQKKGFLKEEGLEAEIIQMQSATAVMTALASREIDYTVGIAASVQPAITGLPIRIVECYVPAPFIVLMAQSRFKSVKELKGTTIAVSNFVGPPFFIAWMIAKQFGLDPGRDVKFLASGTPEARLPLSARDWPLRPCCLSLGIPGQRRWVLSALPERTNYLPILSRSGSESKQD